LKHKDLLRLYQNVKITVENEKTGEIYTQEVRNRIPTAGRNYIIDLIRGENTEPITHFAVGTDDTATDDTDTTLGNEVYRQSITKITTEDSLLSVNYFLSSNEANGNTITEAGIFNDGTAGDMLGRVVYSSIDKDENVSVTFEWDITLAYVEE